MPEDSLHKTQQAFQAYMINETLDGLTLIKSDERLAPKARLDVYRDAYYLRLLEILECDYPGAKQLLAEDFDSHGRKYIDEHLSHHFSIRRFGKNFSRFFSDLNQNDRAEMAKFEWELGLTIDAPDKQAVTLEGLAQFSPEEWGELRFSLHPSVRFIELYTNIPTVWMDVTDGKPAPVIERSNAPMTWVLWRHQYESYYNPLSKEELMMLRAFERGESFGQVCKQLTESLPEAEVIQYAAQRLGAWISQGFFVSS